MDNDSRPKNRQEEDEQYNLTGHQARKGFTEFFKNFHVGGVFYYREALLRNWNKKHYFIEVNLQHVHEYSDMLLNALQVSEWVQWDSELGEGIARCWGVVGASSCRKKSYLCSHAPLLNSFNILFRVSILCPVRQTKPNEILPIVESAAKESLMGLLTTQNLKDEVQDFQAILKSDQLPQSLRNLTAEHVNLLIKVSQ